MSTITQNKNNKNTRFSSAYKKYVQNSGSTHKKTKIVSKSDGTLQLIYDSFTVAVFIA